MGKNEENLKVLGEQFKKFIDLRSFKLVLCFNSFKDPGPLLYISLGLDHLESLQNFTLDLKFNEELLLTGISENIK